MAIELNKAEKALVYDLMDKILKTPPIESVEANWGYNGDDFIHNNLTIRLTFTINRRELKDYYEQNKDKDQ